ncbi:MAG: hypothetical protein EBY28_26850 [Betaproteobacteria bacterium]|nr:hypothetical protein [Betaproteobacteria bacterium]
MLLKRPLEPHVRKLLTQLRLPQIMTSSHETQLPQWLLRKDNEKMLLRLPVRLNKHLLVYLPI